MSERFQLFIHGEYHDAAGGETFEVTCPETNEPLGRVASAAARDVDRAVESARSALDDSAWRDLDVRTRVRMLQNVGALILRRLEELARLEALDTGNPFRDTFDYYVPGAAGCFEFYPPLAYHLTGEQIPISPDRLDYTVYEPLGVVAVITPWNDPLEIAAARLACALAAGNTCVLKPSPLAPLTSLRLGEIFQEAGLPPGVVNVVAGSDQVVGNGLIHHPGVDMISFTGSVETGRLIQRAAAETTKRVSLELGGKSPNIVLPDADLSQAVPGAAQAIYLMSGQNCVAGSRLFVHESLHDEFLERLVEESKRYTLGPILDRETMLGPLISRGQLEKVKGYVARGVEEGARLVLGGAPPAEAAFERGNYFSPTLFAEVHPSMTIAREEIFGPVLCMTRFSTLEEVAGLANDTPYGLGAGIWTRDLSAAHRLARMIQAGTIYINTYNEFHYQAPFAGYKQSGLGSEYGLDALKQYAQRKNVIIRLEVETK